MIRKLLENWLDSTSERSYQPVFVQMLSAKGYRVVHSTRHTALEFGKDVLAIAPNGAGCVYQLKGNPSGKLGLAEFRKDLQPQLVQLMTQAVVFPGFPDPPYNAYLVTNGYIDEEVQRALDDLNRMPYPSKIRPITRGDLQAWSNELGTSLWPSELSDSRLLLEVFLSDTHELLPLKRLSQLISKTLVLSNSQATLSSNAEYYRRITSAALLTGIATSAFAEAENHFAVMSAWTLFAVSIIAASERHGYRIDGPARQTLILVEAAIGDALSQLCAEVTGRGHLVEGGALSDPEVYGWRYVTVLGLLSCLALYNETAKCLSETREAELAEWLAQRHQGLDLWGEGAIASLVPWLIWLRKNDSTMRADHEIAGLVKAVVSRNQFKSAYALPNPYYGIEEVVRSRLMLHKFGDARIDEQETFAGNSHVAEALLHLLVRTNLKQTCKSIWPDFTRLSHRECLPDNAWEYCTLEIQTGSDTTKLYPLTYKWDSLREDAIKVRVAAIPEELCRRAWLMALWWQIAPYRYTADSSRLFVEVVFPGWGL